MGPEEKRFPKPWILPGMVFVLLAASACNFGPSPKKTENNGKTEKKSASAAQDSADPGIDLNCLLDRIQNPPEAFHYSYKHNDDSSYVDEEGDLTPKTMDGTFKNNYVSREFHAARSDSAGWHDAWTNLTAISGMSSTLALVNHSSATVREGVEKMNGYDAIRYSIDTARGTAIENELYRTVLGTGGFEKGTVWVTGPGCPVKFSVDSEMHLKDGTVQKDHYEEAMIKK